MEQFKNLSNITDTLPLPEKDIEKLVSYAVMIYTENRKYNLTGHKTPNEILLNLIAGSIIPVQNLNVPRGTFFADLGTGAGIPGVPLAVYFKESQGVLFDSNNKKINFIKSAAGQCGISNIETVNCRIEEAGKDSRFRNAFDMVFTRAMADIYTACEMGAPLLKKEGRIFIYSNDFNSLNNPEILKHCDNLGLEPVVKSDEEPGRGDEGLLFKKIKDTPDKYPRRIAVIRRESERIS